VSHSLSVAGALALLAIVCTPPAHGEAGCTWQPLRTAGTLAAPALREASGLAASRRDENVLWAVNDSGNPALLHALDREGRDLGQIRVEGARDTDWEDIAAFRLGETPYLLVADIGDNGAGRSRYYLYVVEEPMPAAGGTVPLAWRVAFAYPQGPRDAESVAVDVENGRVLLLTKRDSPPRVYSVPLRPEPSDEPLRAELVGGLVAESMAGKRRNRLLNSLYSEPTAWDISPGAIAVLTYRRLALYARIAGEPLLNALTRAPVTLELPALAQAEALAFAGDARIYVTGEGRGAPLLTTECLCADCEAP
jgi:hypothetical protein